MRDPLLRALDASATAFGLLLLLAVVAAVFKPLLADRRVRRLLLIGAGAVVFLQLIAWLLS